MGSHHKILKSQFSYYFTGSSRVLYMRLTSPMLRLFIFVRRNMRSLNLAVQDAILAIGQRLLSMHA